MHLKRCRRFNYGNIWLIFLILDSKTVYHIGASLKDAGKKCFGITLMKDAGPELMKKIENI